MIIDRNKLLKTVGWSAVVFGLYLVGVSTTYDGESVRPRKTDDIIDAEFTIINE